MGLVRAIWLTPIIICFGGFSLQAQTQGDLDEQACSQFHRADVAMNETYSNVLKEYAKDEQFISKLKTAQKSWLAFRDAHMEALYPRTNRQAEYGTVYPMCHCIQLQGLTEERTKQLKVWLVGIMEGDVCTGSVKVAGSGDSSATPPSVVKRCYALPQLALP